MSDNIQHSYKLPNKILWIDLVFLPVFLLLGLIFDQPLHPKIIVPSDIIIVLVISILVGPVYYWLFAKFGGHLEGSFYKYKINWAKWDKRGKPLFIGFTLLFFALVSILISGIMFIIFVYIFNKEIGLLPTAIGAYIGFGLGLVVATGLWDIHQRKISIEQA